MFLWRRSSRASCPSTFFDTEIGGRHTGLISGIVALKFRTRSSFALPRLGVRCCSSSKALAELGRILATFFTTICSTAVFRHYWLEDVAVRGAYTFSRGCNVVPAMCPSVTRATRLGQNVELVVRGVYIGVYVIFAIAHHDNRRFWVL